MANIRVNTRVVTANETLRPDGFFCVNFFNQGKDQVLLNGAIVIDQYDSHEFNFDPKDKITSSFDIHFMGKDKDRQLVINTIYSE